MYLDVKIFLDKVEEKLNEPIALEIEDILGEMSDYKDESIPSEMLIIHKEAERYRWLRQEYAKGNETYLAEGITSETQLDEYIDKQILE